MHPDDAVHARAAGKAAVARSLAWQLEVGALRLRCRLREDGAYLVEVRQATGWSTTTCAGFDPTELLRRIVATSAIEVAETIRRKQP